ncbi:hypothetical protein BGW36DRAFT_297240 [Talaromyces proteolyticus]|uniref:Uncharacterized protein n=1 Tax=Talaromyces proteolyticus TaxID=1131652 RepID=A0AAD4Q071_9EURO|nr:uncharacterized protein BGW36DRAFT_297240 [Talaromyces proteolyticus]KAH8696726.1 hypothetical protein BGW36DRAFT_297240 [Talaromyces proteolyticus]
MATEMRSFYTPSTSTQMSPHSPSIVDELISKYSSSMAAVNTASSLSPASYGKHRSLAQRLIHRVRLEYYRYEVTFGVYVMSPGEKFVANAFVFVFISLLIWASLLYLPQLLFRKIARLAWLLTGHSDDVAVVFGIFDSAYATSSEPAIATSTRAS